MQLQRIIRSGMVVLGSLCAVGMLAAPLGAQNSSTAASSSAVERGRATYQASCAVCHGDRGNGKGPAASALTPRPTDLTMLSKRTGTFPAARVDSALRGTDPVVAHGDSTMMIWGAVFLADANGNKAKADARIADLVAFIESIQAR